MSDPADTPPRDTFVSGSGRPIERVYGPAPADDARRDDAIGAPGEFPYTRGIHPTMYRSRSWTMRQYAGFATAEESNERYRYLLSQGTTGLSVAFDLPTQLGHDSDAPIAAGEVGRVGVAIDTLADMERLFAGIALDQVSTSMTINATAPILLAMYVATAARQGVAADRLRGTVQNDILKEYAARGTYIFPPEPSLRLTRDVIVYCTRHVPQWNPISISGYHMREAGATAGQEVGFTLANAIAYIERAVAGGLDVDAFAPRLSFFFAVHSDLFEEVAKFRAARRLYATILKERFGATDPRGMMLRCHAQTGGVTLTAQQPDNNVVRVTIQALAAVLGGVQSLHTNAKDEALALPTEASARLALRTQQVIAHESGVVATVDPLGGSYFVEASTDAIEAEARQWIARIDELGGAARAIELGYVQRHIEESAYRFGRSVDAGQRVIVGVNRYVDDTEPAPAVFRPADTSTGRQVERLAAVRASRDPARFEAALANLERTARSQDNLMPALLDAVNAYASVGEICGVLRRVFGEQSPF